MPRVKSVEKKIWDVEGFDVHFQHSDGSNVHGAMNNIPQYSYEKCAKHDMTVSGWKEKRFKQSYPGFEVAVLDGNGAAITAGHTKLGTVRDSYEEDDA